MKNLQAYSRLLQQSVSVDVYFDHLVM